uniref:Isopenicillin N synthase-like Fe(2+) 2OG dioxygenase domain-containing protein n=1 Tax=Salix viminalis TaxID=40686 RepID=A0A6N2N0P9_SALVM
MSSSTGTASPTLRSVTIPYADLKNKDADLSAKIEEDSAEWCKRIPIAASLGLRLGGGGGGGMLANLPQKVKDELEDPHSRYNFGWSHGRRSLNLGSLVSVLLFFKHMADSALPELETALKALGKLMHDVGLMVTVINMYPKEWKWIKMKASNRYFFVLGVIKAGCFIIFLHQGGNAFPTPTLLVTDSDSVSSWCGWHTDHGSLTGLTCAMFKRDGVEIPCPDSTAGLYIKTRTDQIVKVVFGEGEIAYQIGETTEILSRGYLCATPHSVQAPKGEEVSGVDRSTFALFMQPDWDERLNFPKDMHIHKDVSSPCFKFCNFQAAAYLIENLIELESHWLHHDKSHFELLGAQVHSTQPAKSMKSFTSYTESVSSSQLSRCWLSLLVLANSCLTFGEYSEMLLDKYYHLKT